jgi:hypothetical protein
VDSSYTNTPESPPTNTSPLPADAFFTPPESTSEAVDSHAPGPTLLNNTEDEFINNFFASQVQQPQQDLSNSRFDPQQFHRTDQLHTADMASFNWLMEEPAPTFVHASATPKQDHSPPPNHNYHNLSISQDAHYDFTEYSGSNNLLASSQNDILNAATILNNTASSQPLQPQPTQQMLGRLGSGSGILESVEPIHTTEALPVTTPASSYLSSHNQITPQDLPVYGLRPINSLDPLNTGTDINFDGPHTAPARIDAQMDTRLYRFGSDSHFNSSGFIPGSENERVEVVEGRLIEELLLLKPINRSNHGTRPPTPEPLPTAQQTRPLRQNEQGQGSSEEDDVDESQPRKRRKDGSDDGSYGVKSNKMRRTSQNPRLRRVSSVETGSKRRRSSPGASATRQSRENLSEEQKRSNHIQSEQKRRNLIKQGFDELNVLVPELRAGGLSKSMVLTEAGNFLEQLVNVNQQLKQRLGLPNTG